MWRIATADDDEALIALCAALNREDPGPEPVPPAHMRRTLEQLRAEPARGRALALEVGGAVAGYALLIAFWSNELGGEICNIDELYVRSGHRGRGAATGLIRQLAEGAAPFWPRRPVAIELEFTPGNPGAGDFYARLGFAPAKNQLMRLALPKGNTTQ